MEQQFTTFVANYGWQLALIALAGIVILGVLKYANIFSKIEKENRKPVYLAISVGLSIIGSAIYLAVIKKFEFGYFAAIAFAILALNQTMYSIYENTNLRDLLHKIFDEINSKIKSKIEAKENKVTEEKDRENKVTEEKNKESE